MRHIEINPNIPSVMYQVLEIRAMLGGVSRDLIYKMVRENRIPAVHLGSRILFPKKEIERWIDEGCPSVSNYSNGK